MFIFIFAYLMGQKIHPLGFRVGITKKHKSQWFAIKGTPQCKQKCSDAGIESIEIQRRLDHLKIESEAKVFEEM